jgi:amino acid adenylation domain-containing protein
MSDSTGSAQDQASVDTLPNESRNVHPTSDHRLALSFAQEQLWFLDQLSPGEAVYNLHATYRLPGRVNVEALRASLALVLDRHAGLRASFGAIDGIPYQVIVPVGDPLLVVDLRTLPADQRDDALRDSVREVIAAPFALESDPLYRFRLWHLADDEHVLFLGFHHIVFDGWSGGVFNDELATAYRALVDGRVPDLPAHRISYADYVAEQQERLVGAVLEEELRYWEQRLAQLPVLELPADRIRPAIQTHRGDSVLIDFPAGLLESLRALAREQSASLFMVLTTALNIVLSRYTGQEDIPVGVPLLGRIDPEFERVIGLFVNMVVLRTDLTGDPTFLDLLARIADANMEMYEHQEVPFEMVVERVQPMRDPSRNPLFQVGVQVLGESNLGAGLEVGGIKGEPLFEPATMAMFDLVVAFFESEDSMRFSVGYATDIFDRWRVEAMMGHVIRVLTAVVEDPTLRLSTVPLMSDEERATLIEMGTGEQVECTDDPVHVTIAKVAAANPDVVAAVCRGTELTYAELDRRADRLARYLRAKGLQREQVVAVAMDRDVDALVAMVGVWKAGGAFTVIDPTHPVKRLDFMLRDTGAPMVITRSASVGSLPEPAGWSTVLIDAEWDAIEAMPAEEPLTEWLTRDSLAYVLYTSGSTGQPKGVMTQHRGLTLFTVGYRNTFDFGVGSRMLQLPALTFDMSTGEIFTGLTCGATMVLVSPEEGQNPELLATLMREQRVTYAGLPPAILSVVEAGPYPDLLGVMSGADAVPAEMVNKWNLPGRRFVDLYGPTEAAVACTEYVCEHVDWDTPPPIGFPEFNRLMYVVDQFGNLVPCGVPGELQIGGEEGLAIGYLNQLELTDEKFVPNRFLGTGRVYRTGDLVRWMPGTGLHFLGRIDHQVKLRGLRIELGEIEAVLLTHPAVRMAVVLMRPDARGEKQLVGYYTTTRNEPPATEELRQHLADQLPEYMVPTAWVALDDFPLTVARKIDRAALPNPPDPQVAFVPTRTPTEASVADIVGEVLTLDRVGAETNFFELGGNSLQAMRVISRINKKFGVKVNIRMLYGSSTVTAISARVDELASAKVREAERG